MKPFNHGVFSFFKSFRVVRSSLTQISKKEEELQKLRVLLLKLVGTGYKSIVPKRLNRRSLFLRVGFAASELKYSLKNNNIKFRARKQKIVLFWV